MAYGKMSDINDVVEGALLGARKMQNQFTLPNMGLIMQQNKVAKTRADFNDWYGTYFNPDGTEKSSLHTNGTAYPGFQVQEPSSFTESVPSVQEGLDNLLGSVRMPERMQRAVDGMSSPAEQPVSTEQQGVQPNTQVVGNTEMENAIRNELAASDDGTALYAMNVLRALPSVFARYENADPSLAMQNFLGGQQGRTRETEYFPGVSVR